MEESPPRVEVKFATSPPPKEVHLTLTPRQAQMLDVLLGSIGGGGEENMYLSLDNPNLRRAASSREIRQRLVNPLYQALSIVRQEFGDLSLWNE